MKASTFQLIAQEGGRVDLSTRAKYHLTGADAIRYLNGQVTQDVRKARPDLAVHACVTSLKGRIEGDVYIRVPSLESGSGLLLDAAQELREPLAGRLEKYMVADDVELHDVSDDWQLWHVFGSVAQSAPPEGAVHCTRFGSAGYDLWVAASSPPPSLPGTLLSAADLRTWRIIAGIPQAPEELNTEAFPQEAGLEESAMDFTKGCYLGQEILSRIKTSGKMPRKLVKFQVPTDLQAPLEGCRLATRAEDGSLKEAGYLTSFTHHPVLDLTVGLAYVRQGLDGQHSLLLAGADLLTILAEVEISSI